MSRDNDDMFAKVVRMEEKQNANIRRMDAHVLQEGKMLEKIMKDIEDIYDKLSKIEIRQTRLEVIFWLVGSMIVLFTPVITAFAVAKWG